MECAFEQSQKDTVLVRYSTVPEAVDRETPTSEHRILRAARSCTVVGNP